MVLRSLFLCAENRSRIPKTIFGETSHQTTTDWASVSFVFFYFFFHFAMTNALLMCVRAAIWWILIGGNTICCCSLCITYDLDTFNEPNATQIDFSTHAMNTYSHIQAYPRSSFSFLVPQHQKTDNARRKRCCLTDFTMFGLRVLCNGGPILVHRGNVLVWTACGACGNATAKWNIQTNFHSP